MPGSGAFMENLGGSSRLVDVAMPITHGDDTNGVANRYEQKENAFVVATDETSGIAIRDVVLSAKAAAVLSEADAVLSAKSTGVDVEDVVSDVDSEVGAAIVDTGESVSFKSENDHEQD